MPTQEEFEKMSDSEKKKEDWMNSKWRPAMGWLYMGVCFFDFVAFPVLWSLLQAVLKQPVTQWQPLTLQGAGLFHLAMGAVLGLAAWGRTQEKLGGANNGGLNLPSSGASTFGSASTGGFGSTSSFGSTGGFGATTSASSFGSTPSTGFSSTPATPLPTTPTAVGAVTGSGFTKKGAPPPLADDFTSARG